MGNRPLNTDSIRTIDEENQSRKNERWVWFYENVCWIPFDDIVNQLIENAFREKRKEFQLDQSIIDLDKFIEIDKEDSSIRRPIKRSLLQQNQIPIRSQRFSTSEKPVQSFNENDKNDRRFLNECRKRYRKMTLDQLLDQSAQGIVQEGILLEKQSEAQWIAEQLRSFQGKSREDLEKIVIYLYTFESFLYRLINRTLRENDHSKLDTLGPFIQILFRCDCSPSTDKVGFNGILYRGAQLDDQTIQSYQQSIGSVKTWDAFASTSKNRSQAECYGNVLFIITHQKSTRYRYSGMDISAISFYPLEEEVLIRAGRDFLVEKVEEDPLKKKFFIYLSLD